MPELPEVEGYRALAEQTALGRLISWVEAPDAWYLKRGLVAAEAASALVGRGFLAARRRGKLMLLDAGSTGAVEVVLGLHFGMSGRLIVDGRTSLERLLYAPAGDVTRHDRFTVHFSDGGWLTMRDARRLGSVSSTRRGSPRTGRPIGDGGRSSGRPGRHRRRPQSPPA